MALRCDCFVTHNGRCRSDISPRYAWVLGAFCCPLRGQPRNCFRASLRYAVTRKWLGTFRIAMNGLVLTV